MFFVLKQIKEYPHINSRTLDINVRVGGFRTQQGAHNAVKKHAPAIVRDEFRRVVGQTVNSQLPGYIS